jgi:transcriptional regulator with XRE-family HTH domain
MGSPNIQSAAVRQTLSVNVRACLLERRWSESELARRSGVSQKQINNIVRQRTGCGVELLHELGRALGVPYWLLLVPSLGQATAPLQ